MAPYIDTGIGIPFPGTPMRQKKAGGGGPTNLVIGQSFQSPLTVGNHALPKPAGIVAGDRLCAICINGGSADFDPIESANWSFERVINEGAGGGSKIWIRTATADSNDDFTIPNAFTNLRWFVMLACKSGNGWFGSNVGNSNNTAEPNTTVPFSALNAASPARTHQLSLLMVRVPGETIFDAISGPPAGWNTVEFGEVLDNSSDPVSSYGVFWRFDEPPVNLSSGAVGLNAEQSTATVSSRIVAPQGPFA